MPSIVFISRGNAYNRIKQWEKAIDDFDHAIELELETPSESHQEVLIAAYKGRGHANGALGNNKQARQDYETILVLDPNDPEADDIEKILDLLKPQTTESTPRGPSALCSWFAETQILRATRISGATKFLSFFQTRAAADLASLDLADLDELVEALDDYIPHERDFVEQWEGLGSIRGGEGFWEKELEAEKQKLGAFEKMRDGAKAADEVLLLKGRDEFVQATQSSRESEAVMIEIHDKCVDELK
jgi:tetratricopeptide (TPR) repeat protein